MDKDKMFLLKILAKLTRGRASLYDIKSGAGYTVKSPDHIEEATPYEDWPQEYGVREENGVITAWFSTPDGIIVLDNRYEVDARNRYRAILEEALPFVAQVAGGDVVMYDERGCRIKTVNFKGKADDPSVGSITKLCRKTIEEGRPSIGPSLLSSGSTAVRIPLLGGYGLAFNNALAVQQRTRLIDNARQYQYARYHLDDIIGDGPMLKKAKEMAQEVAKSLSTILIFGETGTGKELFAQAIHNLSPRSNHSFVAINCGALPENLVESCLFGYEEGSFTGARKKGMAGVFEQANQGTLFLDEVSEMPLHLQVKLLRVIQEREVVRVGGSKNIPVDIRLIASTNKHLWDMVQRGLFRADLFYRLSVVNFEIPPLRKCKEDLAALACFFVNKYSRIMGKGIHDITSTALEILRAYTWPGNIRELQNCMEHVFNVAEDGIVHSEDLPPYILHQIQSATRTDVNSYQIEMAKLECQFLMNAMRACENNKTAAAKHLGVNRTTLWRLLKRHGLTGMNTSRQSE